LILTKLGSKVSSMIRTNISSKGQLTIPQAFRKRMPLTRKQEVDIEQLEDGSVVVRPVASILELAGSVRLNRPLLTPQQERQQARHGMAHRAAKRGLSK
jgi:bifunctional DNA-binding transcriptional regulator/antitoxin component of YhaV-PrlF toxin-antitoxin module